MTKKEAEKLIPEDCEVVEVSQTGAGMWVIEYRRRHSEPTFRERVAAWLWRLLP